jgi:exo-beta-1,3-glucanase (GH17 family)
MPRWALVLTLTATAGRAWALPTIEAGSVKRAEVDVRVAVSGRITEAEWGAPTEVRVSAGNRSEIIDAAALVERKPGKLSFKGGEVVRSLTVDLTRGTVKAKLAGVGPTFYAQPFWVTIDPGRAFEFALPIADGTFRTRIGGKANHPLDGVVFGPWEDGQDPTQGAVADEKQIAARLRRIGKYTHAVRTYGSTQGLELVPALAQARGLEVAAGAWLGSDPVANQAEIDALVAAAQDGLVDLAIVGSDALGRGDVTEGELLDYVAAVRDALAGTNVPVTTAEAWDVLLAHPAVLAAGDVVAANVHPYREGIALDSAMGAFNDHYQDLLVAAPGKEIVIAETGWPSEGDAIGEAEPSVENAALYLASVRTWARSEGVRVFHASAFDEAWRATAEGAAGGHWGIADARGKLKPGMRAALAGRTVARHWTPGPIGGPGDPTTEVTKIPGYGTFEDLEGRVTHVVPSDYGIVVYILVAERWWVKPRDTEPVTPVGPHGTFVIDVTTGGQDELATRFAVFLIPLTYAPPLLLGEPALPDELYDAAADVFEFDRPAP